MERVKPAKAEQEKSAIQTFQFRFMPYWPVFLSMLLISYGILFLFLKTTNKVYETSASVLIKDEKKGQEDSKMEEVLNVFGQKKIVENELEVLKSNAILDQIVKKNGFYAVVTSEGGFQGLKKSSGYVSCPVAVVAEDPIAVTEMKKKPFSFTPDLQQVTFDGKQMPLNSWINTGYGKIKFIKNPHFVPNPKVDPMKLKFFLTLINIEKATKIIQGGLTVMPASKQSSVIQLKIKDEIPQRAEALISDIVDEYNNASIERKNSVAMKTLNFIETRLARVENELDSMDKSIQRYRDRTGVVDISEQSRLYLQSIENNDRQLNTMDMQLAALDEVDKYVVSKSGQGGIAPSSFNVNDPILNNLVSKLSSDETQYEKLKRTTAEDNPIMQSLREDITKTKASISDNIRNQRKSIQAGREQLARTNGQHSAALSTIPLKERELVEVSRQMKIKNDIYSFLLQKREETAYSISSVLPDCYLVDSPTTSPNPVSPVVPFLALLATILPLGLAFAFFLLRDMINGKVLYRSDINKLTSGYILGEIIDEKNVDPLVVAQGSRSFIVEQFRQIRASLKHLGNPPGKYRNIMITSSVKGEGKSFVSTNLAISLARSGKKVALLEMDLHQPMIYQMMGLEERAGITDFLTSDIPVSKIIYPTKQHENLFLLPAGHLNDDPSELLYSKKLAALIDQLNQQFDFVVIDTPPVRIITDAFIIAQLADLMVYVVRHNYTDKNHLEMIDDDLATHGIRNFAIIFNGIKKRGFGKMTYGYGYGYGYASKTSYDNYSKKKGGKRA